LEIPLTDVRILHEQIKEEIDKVVREVFAGGQYILGPNVDLLEKEMAKYCGTSYGIGVASGTDALILSLLAGGVIPGDEVITTPFTFFATAGAVARVGAIPVFVDIDPDTYNMDTEQIRQKITSRTRAIIPVHLFGQMSDMEPINQLAREFNLLVIEDACQAIGAKQRGHKAGSLGHLGCFSFFPTKNLGGCGDGGMVVTNDAELADRIRMLRVHGSTQKYYHRVVGYNSRLDELQAGIIRVKLRHLECWNEERRNLASLYGQLLASTGVTFPREKSFNRHVYHLYTVRCPNREKVVQGLRQKKIGTGIYYPLPLHLQEAFAYLGYRTGDFPEAERACREVLSLPLYPGMTGTMLEKVVGLLAAEIC